VSNVLYTKHMLAHCNVVWICHKNTRLFTCVHVSWDFSVGCVLTYPYLCTIRVLSALYVNREQIMSSFIRSLIHLFTRVRVYLCCQCRLCRRSNEGSVSDMLTSVKFCESLSCCKAIFIQRLRFVSRCFDTRSRQCCEERWTWKSWWWNTQHWCA